MNDPQIASNLRARAPGALAELFDAYGNRLFRYCWTMLRNHEIAQIALRDTLVVAEAHIARLADPELLGPWLYSLARAECCRRRAVQPSLADEPPARPSQRDADNRLMAWNAVMSMATDELEALDLTCRHDVDLALVLGVPAEDAEALLSRARQSLERALGAEVLIAEGGDGCLERADILDGWGSGTVTTLIRERLMRHAEGCPLCQLDMPQNVSAARVFEQLPAPELSPLVRAQVLGLFANPKLSAYRDFAVNWASALGESGFPVASEPGASEAGLARTGMPEPVTSEPSGPGHARGAAATAAALADLSTDALPVFGPGADMPAARCESAAGLAADRPAASLLVNDLLEAEWPTADLPAVKVPNEQTPAGSRPTADGPEASRPIADVPAARRPLAAAPVAAAPVAAAPVADVPLADALLADWAVMSVPAANSRMANPQVATPAELWFAPAKPAQASAPASAKPEPASSPAQPASFVPAAFTPATLRPAARPKPGHAASPESATAQASPAKPAALWPAAPKSAGPAPGRPVAGTSALARSAGARRRTHVRRNRAILAGIGTMAAAAAIVSSFALSGGGSSGKLVAAGGAAATGRTATSPAGLSASSAPILERQSAASTPAGSPVSSKAPKSPATSTPPLVPVKQDKGQVLIANATQPLTQPVPAPNPGTPEQLVAPASTVTSPPASAPAGTLTVSPATVDLGAGSTDQVTLTAVGGSVNWLAGSPSGLITLSSYSGTLQAGQSVTLGITVARGGQGGSAQLWLEPPAAAPQTVQVNWQSQPGPSGHGWQHGRHRPASPDPSPSAPLPPGAS